MMATMSWPCPGCGNMQHVTTAPGQAASTGPCASCAEFLATGKVVQGHAKPDERALARFRDSQSDGA
jgi:ribosomal protein S27E